MRYLLSYTTNCYVRAGEFHRYFYLPGMRDKSMRSGTELARVHEKVTFTVCMFIFICI